mmetsp:Transcript_35343/g.57197  ORF Transcript_35343/g.57197 Transcript_35343/m.57197 type:complete len:111 (+) Transcript_35343:110-442(+)
MGCLHPFSIQLYLSKTGTDSPSAERGVSGPSILFGPSVRGMITASIDLEVKSLQRHLSSLQLMPCKGERRIFVWRHLLCIPNGLSFGSLLSCGSVLRSLQLSVTAQYTRG